MVADSAARRERLDMTPIPLAHVRSLAEGWRSTPSVPLEALALELQCRGVLRDDPHDLL